MKRLHAFTLLEVLIAMVISTLVIGAGFVGYEFTMKQYYAYKENAGIMNEACAFQGVLKKDISLSSSVTLADQGINCIKKEHSIRYEFHPDFVLRITADDLKDTFRVKNDSLQFMYQHIAQTDPGKQIDYTSFRMDLQGEKQSVIIRKEYGADGIINQVLNERNGWD
jgi:prepilin-type N-terminal cleavage/methylation domain-containing protein